MDVGCNAGVLRFKAGELGFADEANTPIPIEGEGKSMFVLRDSITSPILLIVNVISYVPSLVKVQLKLTTLPIRAS